MFQKTRFRLLSIKYYQKKSYIFEILSDAVAFICTHRITISCKEQIFKSAKYYSQSLHFSKSNVMIKVRTKGRIKGLFSNYWLLTFSITYVGLFEHFRRPHRSHLRLCYAVSSVQNKTYEQTFKAVQNVTKIRPNMRAAQVP